jgi:acetyl-CoA carboxylase carboxyl transferase subunit beta
LVEAAPGEAGETASGGGAPRGGELILALGRVAGRPCVFAAQDHAGPQTAGALRLARRGMTLATELRIPLVTVIDTPGAELSPEAEAGGIAHEIAQCIAKLITLPVPTVSVLLGQGTGGGALALFPADRVVAAGHAWLAPLAPEGASAIVYKDTAHAPELAERQGIRAADLAAAGAVDRVVPENGEPGDLCRDLGHALSAELTELARDDDTTRLANRLRRYRDLG